MDSHAEHRSVHTGRLLRENVLYTSNLPCRNDWKLTLLMIQHRECFVKGYQGHLTGINLLTETAETVVFLYDPCLTYDSSYL